MTGWIVLIPIAYLVWIIIKSKMEELDCIQKKQY